MRKDMEADRDVWEEFLKELDEKRAGDHMLPIAVVGCTVANCSGSYACLLFPPGSGDPAYRKKRLPAHRNVQVPGGNNKHAYVMSGF